MYAMWHVPHPLADLGPDYSLIWVSASRPGSGTFTYLSEHLLTWVRILHFSEWAVADLGQDPLRFLTSHAGFLDPRIAHVPDSNLSHFSNWNLSSLQNQSPTASETRLAHFSVTTRLAGSPSPSRAHFSYLSPAGEWRADDRAWVGSLEPRVDSDWR